MILHCCVGVKHFRYNDTDNMPFGRRSNYKQQMTLQSSNQIIQIATHPLGVCPTFCFYYLNQLNQLSGKNTQSLFVLKCRKHKIKIFWTKGHQTLAFYLCEETCTDVTLKLTAGEIKVADVIAAVLHKKNKKLLIPNCS